MRTIKMLGLAMLAALSLTAAAAGSASALQWNPAGANVGAFTGVLTLTTNTGAAVRCTMTTYARGSGVNATTTNSAGTFAPPVFSSCSNTISSGLSTTVTSANPWSMTATSTSTVTVRGNAVIRIGGICTITVTSATVTGNTWSNAAHSLTANSAQSFAISESGLCDGGTTGRMSGTVTDTSGTATIS